MDQILKSIGKSIVSENWHAVLIQTLILPDICTSIEKDGKQSYKYIFLQGIESKCLNKYSMNL